MSRGKLYSPGDEQSAVGIDYQFHDDSATGWRGEFTLTEYGHLDDGTGYMIELEDGRKGRCSIRRRVNKAVSGPPPLYHYYFRGSGKLQ